MLLLGSGSGVGRERGSKLLPRSRSGIAILMNNDKTIGWYSQKIQSKTGRGYNTGYMLEIYRIGLFSRSRIKKMRKRA
jgi:hypothetical protein